MSIDNAAFEKTFVYRHTGTIAEISADLLSLRQFDARHERLMKCWGVGIGACVLLAMLTSFASGTIGVPTAKVLLGLCLAGFVLSIVQTVRHGRSNLANRRYELAAEVLRLLEKDSPKDATVELQLDLQNPHHASKKQREGKVGPWQVKYFVDPWLKLQGRFLDGTAYRLIGTEKYQARKKRYRGRSGKWKSKSKSKSATQITLSLKPSAKRYSGIEQLSGDVAKSVQLPDWSHSKSVGVANGRLHLTAATTANWKGQLPQPNSPDEVSGPHLVAMMFLSLYQALNQARTSRK